MTYHDVKAAYKKLTAAGVDALIFPHCNFGQEEAVGRLAKDMNLPVLIWGPRDGCPNGLEWRPTDSQCGHVRHHQTAHALRRNLFLHRKLRN